MKRAVEKLDLLVVVDPYPTISAVMHGRTDNVYLLPVCTAIRDLRIAHDVEPIAAVG
jgi:formate dehydrogenase major subunit